MIENELKIPKEFPKRKELPKLDVGQLVRVQNRRTGLWERKAKVVERCDYERSYLLEDINSLAAFRRNRVFLRPLKSGGEEKEEKVHYSDPKNVEVDDRTSERERKTDSAEQTIARPESGDEKIESAEPEVELRRSARNNRPVRSYAEMAGMKPKKVTIKTIECENPTTVNVGSPAVKETVHKNSSSSSRESWAYPHPGPGTTLSPSTQRTERTWRSTPGGST